MAALKVVGFVRSIDGEVTVRGVNGESRLLTEGSPVYEGDQIVGGGSNSHFVAKYLGVSETTAYEGIFRVTLDASVYSAGEPSESVVEGSLAERWDLYQEQTAAGRESTLSSSLVSPEFDMSYSGAARGEVASTLKSAKIDPFKAEFDFERPPLFTEASNHAPVAHNVTISPELGIALSGGGAAGSTITGILMANDIDDDNTPFDLIYSLVSGPGQGSVSISGNQFTFDPGEDFSGLGFGETETVTFTYLATDRHGAHSEVRSVTLTVEGTAGTPVVDDGSEFVHHAQVGEEVFLGGKYIELGIHETGSFGTVSSRPAGFYGVDDTNRIGMVADVDGFGTGIDSAIDFFLPGTPEEAWHVGYVLDGARTSATNAGLAGAEMITDYASEDVSSGDILAAHGSGSLNDALSIDTYVSFDVNDDYFLTTVTLTNISDAILEDVRFMRSFDPDNTVYQGGSYVTINTVESTFEAGDDKAVVSAQSLPGDHYDAMTGSPATILYYSADDRAKVTTYSFSIRNIYDSNVYDNTLSKGSTITADRAISIAFEEGTLDAGESVTFSYYTSLSNRDVEEIVADLDGHINGTYVGSSLDDVFDGEGGADIIMGRGGDDTIVYDPEDLLMDGGDGVDTLVLEAGTTLDLGNVANIVNMEQIDVKEGATLSTALQSIHPDDVVTMTGGGNALVILGSDADAGNLPAADGRDVALDTALWAYDAAASTVENNVYHGYASDHSEVTVTVPVLIDDTLHP